MDSSPYTRGTFVLVSSDPNNLKVYVSRTAYILDTAMIIASTKSGQQTGGLSISVESCGKETISNMTQEGLEPTNLLLVTGEEGTKYLLDEDIFKTYFTPSSDSRCPINSYALTSDTDGLSLSTTDNEYVQIT